MGDKLNERIAFLEVIIEVNNQTINQLLKTNQLLLEELKKRSS